MSANRSELSDLEQAKAFIKDLYEKCVDGFSFDAQDTVELMEKYDIVECRPITAAEAEMAFAKEWGMDEGDGGTFLKDPWK